VGSFLLDGTVLDGCKPPKLDHQMPARRTTDLLLRSHLASMSQGVLIAREAKVRIRGVPQTRGVRAGSRPSHVVLLPRR
jgi:hypothetical protein